MGLYVGEVGRTVPRTVDSVFTVRVDAIFAFWCVALLLIAVPGADWAFTIGASVHQRAVLPAVGGLVLGYAAITAVVAAGVGALVAGSSAALTVLSVGGGGYLVWLGALTLRQTTAELDTGSVPTRSNWTTLTTGIGVSGLNPKGLLVFLALLPQFTDRRGSWPIAGQIAVLGLVFTLTCAVFYLALGTFARRILHARPGATGTVTRISGIGMVAVGALLVVEPLAG
jgi:threonine/homoserine/homoserine lactone efflux protein